MHRAPPPASGLRDVAPLAKATPQGPHEQDFMAVAARLARQADAATLDLFRATWVRAGQISAARAQALAEEAWRAAGR